MSRILKTGKNQITLKYGNGHIGIDIVKYKGQTDYIVAHTEGEVVAVVKNCNATYKTGASYGNYVTIKHPNGMYTHYAHLKYGSVTVSKGSKVKKGQVIGYMGNTGHSFGSHLHFEVRNTSNKQIDPTPYIDADLPGMNKRTVSYRVYCKGRWYATVKDGATAGDNVNGIDGYQIRTGAGCGNTKYKAHVKGGKWLPEVDRWDDSANGYAGYKGKRIDAITMWSEHGDLTYRVKTKQCGWLPWIKGKYGTTNDKYAGNMGQDIIAVEIKFS